VVVVVLVVVLVVVVLVVVLEVVLVVVVVTQGRWDWTHCPCSQPAVGPAGHVPLSVHGVLSVLLTCS